MGAVGVQAVSRDNSAVVATRVATTQEVLWLDRQVSDPVLDGFRWT